MWQQPCSKTTSPFSACSKSASIAAKSLSLALAS
ncbi:Uncharacterised protein [Vibrio cholerae]|nr:Uncharacterised protein [Vibrio cholerae]